MICRACCVKCKMRFTSDESARDYIQISLDFITSIFLKGIITNSIPEIFFLRYRVLPRRKPVYIYIFFFCHQRQFKYGSNDVYENRNSIIGWKQELFPSNFSLSMYIIFYMFFIKKKTLNNSQKTIETEYY